MTNESKGTIYAVASGLSFGLLGYFGVTLMQANLSVYTMLFWRFAIGGLLVRCLLIPLKKTIYQEQPRELGKILLYGMIFYAPTAILYFLACKYMSTGLAMVTFFAYPVIVILLNKLFYGTTIPRIYYGIIFIMTIGMMMLAGNDTTNFDYRGLLLGLASAFAYSFYVVLSKKSPVAPLHSTCMVSIGCMIMCYVAACIDGTFCVPQGLNTWINIIGVGILCTALPILLLLKALKYITSEKASLLSVLEPVFVLIFGVILLDETITSKQMVGVFIVLCGALLTVLSSRSPGKQY